MTKKQIIEELLKDNPPINSTKATEHIDEMELFKAKINEDIERLRSQQEDLLNARRNNEESSNNEEVIDESQNRDTNNEQINEDV